MDIVRRFNPDFVSTVVELSKTGFESLHGIAGDENKSSLRKELQYPPARPVDNSGRCVPGAAISAQLMIARFVEQTLIPVPTFGVPLDEEVGFFDARNKDVWMLRQQ